MAELCTHLDQIQVNIGDLRSRFPEVACTSFADWTQQRITAR
jgi:hypothetical protein